MKYKYYILTILRNGKYQTFVTETNLIAFLLIEQELGHDTVIISAIEITKDEYDYYHSQKR